MRDEMKSFASREVTTVLVAAAILLVACGGGGSDSVAPSPPPLPQPPPPTSPIPGVMTIVAKPVMVTVAGTVCREFNRDASCEIRGTDATVTLSFRDVAGKDAGTLWMKDLASAEVRLNEWSHCFGMFVTPPRNATISMPLGAASSAVAASQVAGKWVVRWQEVLDISRLPRRVSAPSTSVAAWCHFDLEYGSDASGRLVPALVASAASHQSWPYILRVYSLDGDGIVN